jgi:hypothetical protein
VQHNVDEFLFAYRNTPHGLTTETPAELVLGLKPWSALTAVRPGYFLRDNISEKELKERPIKLHP